MPAVAHHTPPSPSPPAPPLHAVAVPDARTAPPRLNAWDVARFALGLTLGFLLAAAALAPGGGAIVTGQLVLAGTSAAVAAVAAWRSHVGARRGGRPQSG